MPGRLNLFQRMMLRWRDIHPYNAVHVVLIPRPFGEVPVAERIGRVLEAHGLTGLVLDRRHRRFDYEGGPAEVVLEVQPGGVDPLGVVCREIERQLNLPFPQAPRANPFRFFAVTGAHSFHLGLAYDHFIAGGESIALLLNSIAEACAGTASFEAAPELYPGTYRGLFLRHPVVPARGLLNLPRLIATSRRSFRPRYPWEEGAHNGFAYFRLDPNESATLLRTAKAWGVTVTDLFLASMLLALSPLAAERHRERRRRELAVASIVNAREDFGAAPQRVFGQFLASFSVAHPVPEGIGLRKLAQDVHTSTARIKRDKLYLQTIIGLGLSDLMWPFLSGARRAGFYAKHHPVWGGVTPLNVDALWGKSGRNDVRSWEYFRAVPTGPLCPLVFAVTTAQDTMHVGVSYRTAAFSRTMVADVTAAFRRCIDGLEKAEACAA
ncbi:MAG: hypothetical protein ABWZ29_01815 [Casimicrobiaceae bacterium]